ncbi:hypothetical protein FJR45_06255 [Sulfurimonas sediminis]|uniref:Uncharacterized protein n=1 Tax=Sulfurimonas sediminis TaxID=2590020 RepID=A0A7M1B1S5_9BACT|nr:hypothetical protein [Sulfurimonas sediminis]QOP43575.1 hypothetical protein FJR45_06255 [Sulfurimonas sediminis]
MQISQNMQSYIQDLKSLSEVTNFKNLNKGDKAFELIYQKAQDAKIDLSNAKEFLSSLSDRELSTIQKNKSLADPINVANVSQEGAYNLLVHGYEDIDYNGDGVTEIGITKSFGILPQEASHEFREKFINTLKEMEKNGASEFDIGVSTIITLGSFSLMKTAKQQYDEDPAMQALMKEHGVDKFIVKTPTFDDNYIAQLKDKLEHPKGGAYISPEAMKSMQFFFKTYDKVSQNYDKNLAKANQEVQQKAETTKVALEKTIPKHESRYETLLKMNFDNMNEVERAEFSHLSANRPLEFLSDEANKALAKSLEGKSDEEKGQIKSIISLEFTTSIKMNDKGNIIHGARDFSKKNHDEVVSKLNKFIDNFYKGGGVDTIGTIDVLKDFLTLYTDDKQTQKVQNATLKDLLQKQSA